jgi:hypothetical protein
MIPEIDDNPKEFMKYVKLSVPKNEYAAIEKGVVEAIELKQENENDNA